jgi:anion-transporting  ArsA/GET3 family ATPase
MVPPAGPPLDPTHVQRARATALGKLLLEKNLVVCLGTGGVGKTTTAALLALAGAYLGRRTAVLTIDPARRLADALGVGSLDSEAREVPADRLWPGSRGTLAALMLDVRYTFDKLVARLVHDEARRMKLLQHPVYQQMVKGLAGVHEYMAVEKLHDLAHDGRFDLVILDTPPSKNALDFIEAPGRVSQFFNEKISKFFLRGQEASRWSITDRLFNAAQDAAMGLLGRFIGDEFVKDLVDFMESFQGLFRAFEERGDFAAGYLRGDKSGYVIVTAPDPTRVEEGLEFATRLLEFRLRAGAFVVNRVRATPAGGVPTAEQAEAAMLAANVPADRREKLAAHVSKHQADRTTLSERDAKTVERLRARVRPVEVLVAPETLESPNDPEALAQVCAAMLGFP